MPGEEFVRRLLLHVMPAYMARVRYQGFLGNSVCAANLERAREQLGVATHVSVSTSPASECQSKTKQLSDKSENPKTVHEPSLPQAAEPLTAPAPPIIEPDTQRECPYCGERALRWVSSFPGTFFWHARVDLAPRKARERLARERRAELAGNTRGPP